MEMYYGGGEIKAFGDLLESMGVDTIAVSYMGLRRRIKHLDKIDLAERFGDGTKLLLDSGCHSINNAPDKQHSNEELKEIADEYYRFVERNIGAVEAYTEFDALQLGAQWIDDMRFDSNKMIVVWHEDDGLDALTELTDGCKRVGITGTSLGDRDLTPKLKTAVEEQATKLYGLGMTKPEQMADIPWAGVTSTSWLSPVKFRDVIVWTGRELKRYPKKNRETGKRRHRTLFRQIGLDPELIETDDGNELLKLSIWSWRQQVAHINGDSENLVTIPENDPDSENAEEGGGGVANYARSMQSAGLGFNAPTARSKSPIPGMDIVEKQETVRGSDGEKHDRTLKIIKSNSSSLLQCTGCFLAGKCPKFDPGSECAWEIPAEADTPEGRRSQMQYVRNQQFRRMAFGLVAEQVEGGYPDANISREIMLYQKLLKAEHDMEQEGFSLTIKANQSTASTQAGAGVLSRLFGKDPLEQQQRAELPPAPPQKSVNEQLGIVDAEVVEEVRNDDAA
ncbi:hypothetical protein [Streptomyces luteogriseus]|uniref:hypothetical protein n=1 Tax=Streptomyces luteogriseus TaxID=68233 RepID=UPI00379D32EC